MIFVVFVFLFVDLFDIVGILVGVVIKVGLIEKDGKILCLNCVLLVDLIVMFVGVLFGILNIIFYIESVFGVVVGGCIGLIVVVVGILFFFVLFFLLLVGMILVYVMAGVFFYVVILMMLGLVSIDWCDLIEVVFIVVICLMMFLIFLIVEGILFGFIVYVVIKFFSGKGCSVFFSVWVMVVIFVIKYILVV